MPIDLVCPACRHVGQATSLVYDDHRWWCASCSAVYPHTVAPVVAHPLAPFVQAIDPAHGASPATLVALAPWIEDDAPSMRLLQRLSVATRSHWGDCLAEPVEASWAVWKPLLDALPNGDVCELGCGAGRVALELATDNRRVVAVDSDPAVLALGTAVRDSGEARAAIRQIGATYRDVVVKAPHLAGRDVTFVLADACNPPLQAEAFDAVVALNVLDNVRVPTTLVGQIDALLKPGGVALISTPYAWDSSHTDDGERIGGALGRAFGGAPEDELRRVLRGDVPGATWAFEIRLDEPRVPFTLTRDGRTRFVYDTHVLVVQKR